MLVGRSAVSSSKAPLRTPSQKINHLCYYGCSYLSYVIFIYGMYLCFIFFQAFRKENPPNIESDVVRIL